MSEFVNELKRKAAELGMQVEVNNTSAVKKLRTAGYDKLLAENADKVGAVAELMAQGRKVPREWTKDLLPKEMQAAKQLSEQIRQGHQQGGLDMDVRSDSKRSKLTPQKPW